MAKIFLENTREHDITLNAANKDGELAQVTVPAARQSQTDKNEVMLGRIETDDAIVAAAKKNPVVAHYFDEGWLRVAKQAGGNKAQEAGNKGGNQSDKE